MTNIQAVGNVCGRKGNFFGARTVPAQLAQGLQIDNSEIL
jgi:hypothetical protein